MNQQSETEEFPHPIDDLEPTKSARSIVGALTTLAGASLTASIVAFISNVLTARAMGPDLRGHIAFVLQASYFLSPLIILASDRALLRSGKKLGEFYIAGRRALIGATLLSTIICYALFQDWRTLIAPGAAVGAWFLLRRAEVAAHGGYRRYALPFLSFQAGILISHLLLYATGTTFWPLWLAAYTVPALFLLLIPPSKTYGHRAPPLRNIPFMASSLSTKWSLRGERLILPAIAGPSALGLYIVVATATEPLFWVAQSLADHRVGDSPPAGLSERLRQLAWLSIPFGCAAAFIGLVIWLSVVPIFGPDYEPAREFILPLTLASVALAGYRLMSGWVLGGYQPRLLGTFETCVALVAAIAYPVGIVYGSALGAAWATLVVYASAILIGLIPVFHGDNSRTS